MSNVPPYLPLATRDVRFDLFRGLANWAIFLDHIPHDVMSWITIKVVAIHSCPAKMVRQNLQRP
jgi:hypothetical protein